MRRNPALDGLRGIAVVAVVLFHVGLLKSGFLGVDVFFVLSGFLITSLVAGEHRRTGNIRLGTFYARRALRLYPALVVVVAAVLGVAVVVGEAVRANVHDALASLLYVSNLTGLRGGLLDHTWTLSIEEQFYLVWPAVLLLCLGPRRRLGIVLALVIVTGLLGADLATGRDGALHTYVRGMGLPLGCALSLGRGTRAWRILAKVGPASLVVLLACLFLPLPGTLTTGWPVSCGALLAVPVVAMAAQAQPTGLRVAPLTWLGLRSYSLYLWHLPLISLAGHHAPSAVPHRLALTLGLVASLIAAELSYRFVEQTVLRWRDRAVRPVAAVATA